jgi:hypothetical protein
MCSLFKETAYWVSKLHWHFPLIFPNGNVSELHWNISELLWTPRGKPLEVSWVSGGKKTVRLRDSKEHRGKHRIRFLTLASMAQRHRKSGLRKMRGVNCEQKSMLQTLFQLTWRQEIAAGDFPEFGSLPAMIHKSQIWFQAVSSVLCPTVGQIETLWSTFRTSFTLVSASKIFICSPRFLHVVLTKNDGYPMLWHF